MWKAHLDRVNIAEGLGKILPPGARQVHCSASKATTWSQKLQNAEIDKMVAVEGIKLT